MNKIKDVFLRVYNWFLSLVGVKDSKTAVSINFKLTFLDYGIVIFGKDISMILTATQQVELAIKPVDKKQNPAQIDGVPTWKSTNTEVVSLVPSADGLSCLAVANKLGDAQVSVTADADLGTGIRNIIGIENVTVVAGEAVALSIISIAPVEQP